jgi:hypothetical protein
MKMVSMKRAKKDQDSQPEVAEMESLEYPWGLVLSLETEQLKALGMNTSPEVGTELMAVCKVTVTSCSAEELQGGEKQRTMRLQITDLGLKPDKGKSFDTNAAAKVLYGSMHKGE